MEEIKLLDCTLRDGGYVNDWKFGSENLTGIFRLLAAAGIDMIEIGFIDERVPYDRNRSIMPDVSCVKEIYSLKEHRKTFVLGMIDYGTCSLKHITPCRESFLDGIRVIFKKDAREQAMDFCAGLKRLGYRVFAQLVSITSYDAQELLDLARLANQVKPYAVSIVDTYGLIHQDDLLRYACLLDQSLYEEIGIGYHGHNNLQMAYANCIALLSRRLKRRVIVDGSIYGMGKCAGNAPTELIAMYLNRTYGTSYQIGCLLEAADTHVSKFYKPAAWGYNLLYFLAALHECHPKYVSDLMEKHAFSIREVHEILKELEIEKKLVYDKEYSKQVCQRSCREG